MIATVKNTDQLIEGVLDQGLSFIGDYLQKRLYLPVLITDHNGLIYFPVTSDPEAGNGEIFIDIPAGWENEEFYYCQLNCTLYYRIPANPGHAYVAAEKVSADRIPELIDVIRDCKLAVKCYFSKINNGNEYFEKELTDYLFSRSHANLRDIMHGMNNELDIKRPCYVMMVQVEAVRQKIEARAIRSYINEYMRREKLRAITLYRENQVAVIVPVNDNIEAAEAVQIEHTVDLKKLQESLSHCFKMTVSIGAGQIKPFENIDKSFDQARITIILNHLMGKSNFICKFSELGVYRAVFSQDLKTTREYCDDILSKLIEHDCKSEGELLPTLRKLLDTCGNIKATADSLFIHVNTLYYRINKIEQILEADLSKMDTRVDLHTAIKVYDTLQILDGAANAAPSVSESPAYALQA